MTARRAWARAACDCSASDGTIDNGMGPLIVLAGSAVEAPGRAPGRVWGTGWDLLHGYRIPGVPPGDGVQRTVRAITLTEPNAHNTQILRFPEHRTGRSGRMTRKVGRFVRYAAPHLQQDLDAKMNGRQAV